MSRSRANISAFDVALNYITFKDRTERELYTKLKDKGYSDLTISETISKLKEYGYINEENYAFSYIKGNIDKKSKKVIRMELVGKGLDKEIVNQQLDLIHVDETEVILDSIGRRYYTYDFSDERQLRKIYSYYARRGYNFENIRAALSKYRNLHENFYNI